MTSNIIPYILAIIFPYLICGLSPAIIVTKIKSGVDIRSIGSGNAGLTNVFRTQGKLAAFIVLILDLAKGCGAILIIKSAFNLLGIEAADWFFYFCGIFAVLGHIFPIYYKFKGGKGVLVTAAVLYALDPLSATSLITLFAIISVVTRYVSIGSIVAATAYPFCVYFASKYLLNSETPLGNALSAGIIALILIAAHIPNIKRLINGTEHKFGQKNK